MLKPSYCMVFSPLQFTRLGFFLCLNLTQFDCLWQEQVFSENDAFFAWTFVKRHPLWQTLLSFFWPVLTLAICLFPVYPHRCKLLILYSCAGILFLILSLLLSKVFFPLIFDCFCLVSSCSFNQPLIGCMSMTLVLYHQYKVPQL